MNELDQVRLAAARLIKRWDKHLEVAKQEDALEEIEWGEMNALRTAVGVGYASIDKRPETLIAELTEA